MQLVRRIRHKGTKRANHLLHLGGHFIEGLTKHTHFIIAYNISARAKITGRHA